MYVLLCAIIAKIANAVQSIVTINCQATKMVNWSLITTCCDVIPYLLVLPNSPSHNLIFPENLTIWLAAGMGWWAGCLTIITLVAAAGPVRAQVHIKVSNIKILISRQ